MPVKSKKVFLFLFILITKLIWILFINNHFKSKSSIGYFIAISGADTHSYIQPIENYIETGNYGMMLGEFTPFQNHTEEVFYPTIRTPHYGILYFLFRIFFTQQWSFELLAFLQLIVEVFAILAFSSLIYDRTHNKRAYYLGLFFLTFSTWVTFYASEIMTESLTCSFIIFSLYFFNAWLRKKKNTSLLLTGFFMSYAILMKPFLIPWLICFFISILLTSSSFKVILKNLLVFSTSFLILLAPWIIRNYRATGEIIVFTKPMFYPCKKLVRSCTDFITAWGGDAIWWEGKCKTAGTYFFQTDVNENCEYKFPDYVFTVDYNLADFKELRNQIAIFQSNTSNDSMDFAISSRFEMMKESFIKNRPVVYYVITPFLRMKSAFFKSGSYYINGTNLPLKAIKILQTILYWLPLFFGTLGLLIFGFRHIKNPFNLVLAGLPVCLIVTLAFIIKVNEWRYFIHLYPILIFFMIQFYLEIKNKLIR